MIREKRLELERRRQRAIDDENLAITDAPGPGDFHNLFGDHRRLLVLDPDRNLDLRQKRQTVLTADIALEVAFLPAVTLRLADDARRYAALGDRLQDRLRTKRLDDDGQLLHVPLGVKRCGTNRLVFRVTGPVSSRMPMPHA